MPSKYTPKAARLRKPVRPIEDVKPLDPLDYMLKVIGDPRAPPARRDRLALAALPYCHVRPGDVAIAKAKAKVKAAEPELRRYATKREARRRAAEAAVAGEGNGDWGDDLRVD
jgi:hypothetical protein